MLRGSQEVAVLLRPAPSEGRLRSGHSELRRRHASARPPGKGRDWVGFVRSLIVGCVLCAITNTGSPLRQACLRGTKKGLVRVWPLCIAPEEHLKRPREPLISSFVGWSKTSDLYKLGLFYRLSTWLDSLESTAGGKTKGIACPPPLSLGSWRCTGEQDVYLVCACVPSCPST